MNTGDYASRARDAVADLPAEAPMGSGSRRSALAIAWVNETCAFWEDVRRDATQEFREKIELAIEMAKEDSPEGWDYLCGPTHPPFYAVIRPLRGFRDPWIDGPKYAVSIQHIMGDVRPFWAHYLNYAADELEKRKAKQA